LVPRKDYADKLTNIMLVDYANDVSSFLDFDNLDLFLADGETIISHKYSNLVLYVDSVNTNINDSMLVFITYVNSSGDDEPISSELESYAIVYSLSDSIVIPMGAILQKFQSGKIEMYDQLKLKTWDNYYNYSLLSIQHNARLDIMYTK
jgi:hypothetical protein